MPASAKKNRNKPGEHRYRLPVARRWVSERKILKRHHDYPAWDLAIPRRREVKAVTAGRVRAVTRWGACGKGVIIQGFDGYQYTYCHGSGVSVKKRRRVRAGQRIMLSGSTGHSTGPHLHLQIRGPRGALICPQPLLRRWAAGHHVSPRASSSRGCAYSPDLRRYRKLGPSGRDRRPARATHGSRRPSRGKSRSKAKDGKRPDNERSKRGRKRARKRSEKRSERRSEKATRGAERARRDRDRGRGRKAKHRAASRRSRRAEARARRRARARAERIRLATAARRAELAMVRRIRPII